MKNLESRITELEKLNGSNQEEIFALLDEENLNVLERTSILFDLGVIDGGTIASLISEGYEKKRDLELKLEKVNITDSKNKDQISNIFEEENLYPVDAETVIDLIVAGSKRDKD